MIHANTLFHSGAVFFFFKQSKTEGQNEALHLKYNIKMFMFQWELKLNEKSQLSCHSNSNNKNQQNIFSMNNCEHAK